MFRIDYLAQLADLQQLERQLVRQTSGRCPSPARAACCHCRRPVRRPSPAAPASMSCVRAPWRCHHPAGRFQTPWTGRSSGSGGWEEWGRKMGGGWEEDGRRRRCSAPPPHSLCSSCLQPPLRGMCTVEWKIRVVRGSGRVYIVQGGICGLDWIVGWTKNSNWAEIFGPVHTSTGPERNWRKSLKNRFSRTKSKTLVLTHIFDRRMWADLRVQGLCSLWHGLAKLKCLHMLYITLMPLELNSVGCSPPQRVNRVCIAFVSKHVLFANFCYLFSRRHPVLCQVVLVFCQSITGWMTSPLIHLKR